MGMKLEDVRQANRLLALAKGRSCSLTVTMNNYGTDHKELRTMYSAYIADSKKGHVYASSSREAVDGHDPELGAKDGE